MTREEAATLVARYTDLTHVGEAQLRTISAMLAFKRRKREVESEILAQLDELQEHFEVWIGFTFWAK